MALHRDPAAFARHGLGPLLGSGCPRAVFLVAPDGFALAAESASSNAYMHPGVAVDGERARRQHAGLVRALSETLPALCFAGREDTPDAVFPNNVFATAPGRLLVGHMRHAVRQREAERPDIRGLFTGALGYREIDLSRQPGVCELTGSAVIDRARGLGLVGLSSRCDAVGAAAMHQAFGLGESLVFELAPSEYHSNVVMSVLAGRALVIAPDGFADPAVPARLAALYAPHVVELDAGQRAAFAGNCIAVTLDRAWFSATAADALRPAQRAVLQRAGLALAAVDLDEIEKAGGSLRCCVGEIY